MLADLPLIASFSFSFFFYALVPEITTFVIDSVEWLFARQSRAFSSSISQLHAKWWDVYQMMTTQIIMSECSSCTAQICPNKAWICGFERNHVMSSVAWSPQLRRSWSSAPKIVTKIEFQKIIFFSTLNQFMQRFTWCLQQSSASKLGISSRSCA